MAATLNEADLKGGDFPGLWSAPTAIGAGPVTISGTWSGHNDYDILVLTGLAPGAQKLTFTFAPIGPTTDSFAAGGVVKYKTSAFDWAWDGTTLGQVDLKHKAKGKDADQVQSWVLTLADSFAGPLYLGLYGTHGALAWTIEAPGNAAAVLAPPALPAAVPVPAGLLLLGSALAGLAFWRRRRA